MNYILSLNLGLIIKYIFGVMICIAIICTPAYLARQTKKDKINMGYVRLGSWLFGWTIIGWLFALFWGSRK